MKLFHSYSSSASEASELAASGSRTQCSRCRWHQSLLAGMMCGLSASVSLGNFLVIDL
jgi:hypothetical protein